MTTTTRPWKPPIEVPLSDMPRRNRSSTYDPFITDVLQRLSHTPSAAIAYPFADEDTAILYMRSAPTMIRKRYGNGYISMQRNANVIYVYRGPNYKPNP